MMILSGDVPGTLLIDECVSTLVPFRDGETPIVPSDHEFASGNAITCSLFMDEPAHETERFALAILQTIANIGVNIVGGVRGQNGEFDRIYNQRPHISCRLVHPRVVTSRFRVSLHVQSW
jgi:hypothetical protein